MFLSGENLDNVGDQVADSINGAVDKGKNAAIKAGLNAAKKAVAKAGAEAVKATLWYIAALIGWPLLLILIFIIVIYGVGPATKSYSPLVKENSIQSDVIESYIGDGETQENSNSRSSRFQSKGENSSRLSILKRYDKVVMSEENQAIENYHYYKSAQSVLDNKIYMPLKGIDIAKESNALMKELVSKGVIAEEGNERFITEDSLTEIEKKWMNTYAKDGGSFTWTDPALKKKLDKKINTGITVKGFNEKYIGDLQAITDENKKLEIKDAYSRENYFQLPEELLASLNNGVYNGEYIYDDPFVKGVKFQYKKVADKKGESEKKGKEKAKSGNGNDKADNSKYTAEMFDAEFAKQNGVLRGKGQVFIDYANKYDIDAALAVAIAVEESGRGTSSLARNNYNFFGMRAVSGGWRKFSSVEEGIEGGISYISRKYISQGIVNIKDIGKIYCVPPDQWIANVSKHYKTITGREYESGMAGQGYGSNLTAFRGVPEYEIRLDSYGIKDPSQTVKYGLGTVFLYKPTVEIEVKRGVNVRQVLKSTLGKKVKVDSKEVPYDGKKKDTKSQTVKKNGVDYVITTEYEVKADQKVEVVTTYEQKKGYTPEVTATPIEEVNVKVHYVLDKAITFAGVYDFEYGISAEETGGEASTSEREVKGALDSKGNQLKEVERTEYKTIKILEKPLGVKGIDIKTNYMDSYLANFKSNVPKHIVNGFNVNKMLNAFKGEKGTLSDSSSSTVDTENKGSDYENVEKLRPTAEKIGAEYGIDPNILLALIYNESKGIHHIDDDKRGGQDSYIGLAQMGGPPKAHDVYDYFSRSEVKLSANYAEDDRVPHCPKGSHDEKEHQRVEELHFTYIARRLTNQMAQFISKYYGKNVKKDSITDVEMKYAMLYSFCAYNSGAGGQNRLVTHMKKDFATLYGAPGTTYTQIYKTVAPNGTSKEALSNARYLEKGYKDYALFAGGDGIDKSVELFKYDPSKWFIVGKLNTGGVESGMSVAISSNGSKMNYDKVKAYIDYEKSGKNNFGTKLSTITANISIEESDMIRKSAIGMVEGKPAYDVISSKEVFWMPGYAGNYFDQGLPSKPLLGDEMSNTIWSGKIRESSYTGGRDGILDLSRMYGSEVYAIIKRAISQEGKEFNKGGEGPYSFDHSGLIWYVYNFNSKVTYFEKNTVEGYYNSLNISVEEGDIRPGDIVFYSLSREYGEKPSKAAIYLGNEAILYIDESKGVIRIGEFEDFKQDKSIRVLGIKRILKYGSPNGVGTISGVGELPSDLVSGDWLNPMYGEKHSISSSFGMRIHPISKIPKFHAGTDMPAITGTKIKASRAGTVITSKRSSSFGEYVVINHGDGYTSLYAHMSKRNVQVGDVVEQGAIIGFIGSTGDSTGPHLHFEIVKGKPMHTNAVRKEYPEGDYIDAQKVIKGR